MSARARRLARLVPAVALALTAATVPVDAADGRRAFSIEDLYRVRDPGSIDVSPDGRWIAYTLRSTDLPRGASDTDLWRVATAGGEPRRLTHTPTSAESDPAFSPDGSTLAFVAARDGQAAPQIWLMPSDGGEARPLTSISTGASEPVWSPDGKRIAFVSEVRPECGADDACNRARIERKAAGPLTAYLADDLLYRHWTTWNTGAVAHVLVVELDGGRIVDATPGEAAAPAFTVGGGPNHAFTPGGDLVFTRSAAPRERRAWSTNVDLWMVPAAALAGAGAIAPIDLTAANLAHDGHPGASPDGRLLAYLSQDRPGYESDRFRLRVREFAGGAVRDLTAGFDDWVDDFAWLPDASGVVFVAQRRGSTPVFRVRLDGEPPVEIADFAQIDEIVVAPDGRSAYVVRRAIAAPREIWRLDLSGGAPPERLTFHNRTVEDEVDLRPAERVEVPVGDGRTIDMFVILPHGFEPGRRYPAILNVHGGPQSQWADAFRGDWQMYPGAGYVLAFPNPSGSTGRGQAFVEEITADWGGQVHRDLMAAADWLAARPHVDPQRIGAMGWSYGGYMMNWFQTTTKRFRALACMMGLFDLRAFHLTTEELWFPEWDLGGRPWDSDQYERWNPAARIPAMTTPMLIVTGEQDFRVPYTQSLMAFTALRRRDVPARLIVLPESGHWPGWYDMALYYTAHLDWFHRWLGGDPPPWTVEDFLDNAVFDKSTGARIDGAGRGAAGEPSGAR